MAGILGIYGLIAAVILNQRIGDTGYTYKSSYSHCVVSLFFLRFFILIIFF